MLAAAITATALLAITATAANAGVSVKTTTDYAAGDITDFPAGNAAPLPDTNYFRASYSAWNGEDRATATLGISRYRTDAAGIVQIVSIDWYESTTSVVRFKNKLESGRMTASWSSGSHCLMAPPYGCTTAGPARLEGALRASGPLVETPGIPEVTVVDGKTVTTTTTGYFRAATATGTITGITPTFAVSGTASMSRSVLTTTVR
jgi:hypothetical protein